jgi:hypothetical protein
MGKNKKNRNIQNHVSDQPRVLAPRAEEEVDLSQVKETKELVQVEFESKGGTIVFEDGETDADKRRILTARCKVRILERLSSGLGRREFIDNLGYFKDAAIARENPWLVNWMHDVVFGKDIYVIYVFFNDSADEIDKYLKAVIDSSPVSKF